MKKKIFIGGIIIVIVLVIWQFRVQNTPEPFPLVAGEAIISWNFNGVYTGDIEYEARVNEEIKRLKGLLGEGIFTDYELYISIANQYELLGDGKKEYKYLQKALEIDSVGTGIAWHNLGKLLTRLGALESARVAYDNMVAVQGSLQYQRARLEFLHKYMPENTAAIDAAENLLRSTDGEFVFE